MLTKKDLTEQMFQDFLKAGFGNRIHTIHPIQMQEMRRAFYAGLSSACFEMEKRELIISECRHFFETEVKEHIASINAESKY